MVDDETLPVLCGKCHVSPERGFERDGEMWAACPVCGKEDRVEDISREAAEYLTDKAAREMLSGIGIDRISIKYPPEREYRWITG